MSGEETQRFESLLAEALGITTRQWSEVLQAENMGAGNYLQSSTVFLGHDATTNNLISSHNAYNNATMCDGDSSDMDRLFVYNISASGSRNFRWTAPNAGYLTSALLLAYHVRKPGIKGIVRGSQLHVCIGDTIVNLFSNTAIWGHNHIGRKLKIRQR